MIQYIPRVKKNPSTGVLKYYAQMAPTTVLNFKGVASQIEKMCTATDADIKAVLMSLETVVTSALKNGQTVRLGELGSFRPTISSQPSDTANEVSAAKIKAVRCRYTPGANVNAALKTDNLEFQAYKYPTTSETSASDSPSSDDSSSQGTGE